MLPESEWVGSLLLLRGPETGKRRRGLMLHPRPETSECGGWWVGGGKRVNAAAGRCRRSSPEQ